MGLTSTPFLVLLALATLGLPACLLVLWGRLRGPQAVKAGTRLGLIAASQCAAVLLALVAVNDQYLFFTSWQDVLGAPPAPGTITAARSERLAGPLGAVYVSQVTTHVQADGGQLLTEVMLGSHSHVTGRVLVHLPAGYATSGRAYPVIELLQGWHSGPATWINNLGLLGALATEQRLNALGPVIAVMPDINVAAPRDVECTNVPGGPQAETWLTSDVHDLVLGQFRALPSANSWSVMGFSTGGYCAAKLALRQPGWFHSAVVLSGYFDALKDHTTGDLWGGDRQRRNDNSPLWLITHRPTPTFDLLAFASRHDQDSYPSTAQFLSLPHGNVSVYSLIAAQGGHNFKALRAALPELLGWVGQRLSTSSGATAVASRQLARP